ncbi:hypothetical protein N7466_002497 [Penicillium verhagenii]|uniref:uncharacterized protein n=1 Tax=Penicillium verhagenii TaxID=1562060 RepID=UPI002544E725|nr:uncharacterized protein N7466_002497 [Penicillium verhagenii]KAJ5939363.1 hypothetical protein N7466_002497 [Penicillium verhagenii]
MPFFRPFFQTKHRAASTPPATRHTWHGLRRSKSATLPSPEPTVTSGGTRAQLGEDGTNDAAGYETDEQLGDSIHPPLERQTLSIIARHNDDSTDRSRSGRLKHIMNWLHLTRSPESSSSESARHTTPEDTAGDPTTTGPAKKDIPPVHATTVEVELEITEPAQAQRVISSQTVLSQDSIQSTTTVNRRPSQHIPVPISKPQEDEYWTGFLDDNKGKSHVPEPSDPFSDGKNVESRHQAEGSARQSVDRSKRQSMASVHSPVEGERQPSSKRDSIQPAPLPNASRISSVSSYASRGSSRLGRVDQSKAAVEFDRLAAQLQLPITIQGDEGDTAVTTETDQRPTEETQRRIRFGRMRQTKSNLTLAEAPQLTSKKLRRTKTFAGLGRRPSPMSSLRGKTVEFIARVGGHSYLILPLDLAPAPLQLPACIVAMVIYLQRSGDMKAATSLYNHFANQVLFAERDAHKIAMTTRVVTIPHTQSDPNTIVLSVGWVFKEILAGLPTGILGSVRLFQVLYSIYLASRAHPECMRLITLAIMALTGEMQCALICAVFGLFTSLLPKTDHVEEEPSDPHPGTWVRPVARQNRVDGLARVFGPMLIGKADRDRAAHGLVEQEVQEQRVVGLLLDHWRNISRQLREFTKESRKRE